MIREYIIVFIDDDEGCTSGITNEEIVRCKDCKHRPFVPEGETYEDGFSIVGDEICPRVCDDGWYSWIPPDNHYCSYGERIE